MRELSLDEPADLVYCPFRSLLHLPTGTTRGSRSSTASPRRSAGRPLRLERLRLRPGDRDRDRRPLARPERGPQPLRLRPGRQPRRRRAGERRDGSLWWVDRAEWEAAIDDAGLEVEALYGWFDRRPFDDASREFVYVARKPMRERERSTTRSRGSTTRGRRPSRRTSSSTSRRPLASGGPVVELAVGTGRIAVPDRTGRRRGDRRRRVRGDARRGPGLRGARGRRRPRRPAPRRPPRAAGGGARAARHVPFRSLLHLRERRATSSRRCALRPGCSRPRAASCSTSSPRSREDIEETDGRWLERERGIFERADWDERARTLTLSVRWATTTPRRSSCTGSRRARVASAADRGGRLRRRGALRLVRPPPVRRRRGQIWVCRKPGEQVSADRSRSAEANTEDPPGVRLQPDASSTASPTRTVPGSSTSA